MNRPLLMLNRLLGGVGAAWWHQTRAWPLWSALGTSHHQQPGGAAHRVGVELSMLQFCECIHRNKQTNVWLDMYLNMALTAYPNNFYGPHLINCIICSIVIVLFLHFHRSRAESIKVGYWMRLYISLKPLTTCPKITKMHIWCTSEVPYCGYTTFWIWINIRNVCYSHFADQCYNLCRSVCDMSVVLIDIYRLLQTSWQAMNHHEYFCQMSIGAYKMEWCMTT